MSNAKCLQCEYVEGTCDRHAMMATIDAAQAEVTALRARVDEVRHERDEWKAKAEAAERNSMLQWNIGIRRTETAERERDEAAAQVERLREALTKMHASAFPHPTGHPSMFAAWKTAEAALFSPIAPWLAERDRALAMRVAERVYADAVDSDKLHTDLAAIVAEVVP